MIEIDGAMRRLDELTENFETALRKAEAVLKRQGFTQAGVIAVKILDGFKRRLL